MHRSARHRWIPAPILAAGLVLCLAACHPAAPSSDGAAFAFPQKSPSPTPSPSPPIQPSPPARTPAPVVDTQDIESLVTLSETDPRAALLNAAEKNLGPSSTYIRGNFLQRWAERDFTAALAYADESCPGPEREELLGRLALLLANTLPAEAAAIVAQDMSPGATRDEAAISVLHRWTLADPIAAQAWASAFPPGPLRERALREVAENHSANTAAR